MKKQKQYKHKRRIFQSFLKSSLWKTAKEILKGKAKGSKLLVLGVFLIGTGVAMHITTKNAYYGSPLELIGFLSFAIGLTLYFKEANRELGKKEKRPTKAIREYRRKAQKISR